MLKHLLFALSVMHACGECFASEAYVRLNTYNYSEPTSINSFLNEFNGRFEGGTQAFAHEWLEVGARYANWELGMLTRYDYDLSFSDDLAELYYRSVNKLPLEIGRRYRIDLRAKHYKTDGLRLGRWLHLSDRLQVNIGLAYLRGRELMDGRLNGEATAIADNDYDFSFRTDYHYSDDPLFERKVEAPDGWGYSLDLTVDWRPLPELGLHLQVNDLWGRIFWEQAPHTMAVASSDNKTYDEDGYVKFLPSLSGLEEYRDFTQELNPFGSLTVDYRISPGYQLVYNSDFTAETYFNGVGTRFAANRATSIALLYYPETEVWEIDLQGSTWRIRLAGDALVLDSANLVRISGYLSLHF
ncbi:MAG: hypothetical protein QNJ78_04940 [Gammaproteobacteria bacterium]|nr:hypothetical protein [Gammaproteobacteria bacterium]